MDSFSSSDTNRVGKSLKSSSSIHRVTFVILLEVSAEMFFVILFAEMFSAVVKCWKCIHTSKSIKLTTFSQNND